MRLLLAFALAGAAAAGQNPPGLQFEIALSEPRPAYHLGERISLRHCFSADVEKTYFAESRIQDRVGRQNGSEIYEIEPAAGVTDPLQGTGRESGGLGGLSGGDVSLSAKPFCFDRDLNEYVRFLKPGAYRLRVRTNRVQKIGAAPGVPPLPAVSNHIELRIVPAGREWLTAQLSALRARLDKKDETARRELRYLFTLDAAQEMLSRFRTDPAFDYYLGLLSSPFRTAMATELEQRVTEPDWPFDMWHVECLVQLDQMAAYPQPIPYSPTMSEAERKAAEREGRARGERRLKYEDAQLALVAASLDRKRPSAAGASVRTLVAYSRRYSGRPAPAWRAAVTEFARGHFGQFDSTSQDLLLNEAWRDVQSPLVAPALERRLAAETRYDAGSLLLARLSQIDPDRARRFTVQRLRAGEWPFGYAIARALPDSMPAEFGTLLADAYDQGQSVEALIARYAAADILPHLRARYEQRGNYTCFSPIHFYFLRVAPDYGRREVERMLAKPSACLDLGFAMRELGPWAYSPALEQLALSLLMHPSVPVKRGAAEVLGWYGSPQTQAPLWKAFEYWREWWKGRGDELKPRANEENLRLEEAYRSAIARAAAWVLAPTEWSRLQNLCVTDWCRGEVKEWERRSTSRPEVVVDDGVSRPWFGVIGPYQAPTEAMFLAKPAQYPPGTVFEWSLTNRNPEDFEPWRARFAALGRKLERAPVPGR